MFFKGKNSFSSSRIFYLAFLAVGFFTLLLTLAASIQQEIQHEELVISIEVPVRVFKGNTFVDNLSIDDFEVYEDGVLQRIEAIYLIKKTSVAEKLEKKRKFNPDVSRRFVLVFDLQEYLPRIRDVVNEFFDGVISPGDSLYVITPVKSYNFKKQALTNVKKKEITDQLIGILKKDLVLGSSDYRSLMRQLEDIIKMEDVPSDQKLSMYLDTARKLRDMKIINEQNLKKFSDFLKNKEGQKHVFIFYQMEFIPLLPGIDFFSQGELWKDISFGIKRVRRLFSDSSISVNFLFVTNKPGMHDGINVGRMKPLQVEMLDQSYNIFSAFKKVSTTTGGIADSSANVLASFQKAATAAENYYLVYYSPKDYTKDGKYRKLEVKVKNKNYRITHRAGYFAE